MQISDVQRQRHMGAWFPHALLSVLEQELVQSREEGCKELGVSLRQVDHLLSKNSANILTAV